MEDLVVVGGRRSYVLAVVSNKSKKDRSQEAEKHEIGVFTVNQEDNEKKATA